MHETVIVIKILQYPTIVRIYVFMTKSDFPSIVTIGSFIKPGGTVFEFLCNSFPKISQPAWQNRM
jgi:hypothetical protein